MTGARAAGLSPLLRRLPAPHGSPGSGRARGGTSGPSSSPAHLCRRLAGSALSHTCGREGPRILCSAEGRSPPLLWGLQSSPPPGMLPQTRSSRSTSGIGSRQ